MEVSWSISVVMVVCIIVRQIKMGSLHNIPDKVPLNVYGKNKPFAMIEYRKNTSKRDEIITIKPCFIRRKMLPVKS